MKTYLNLQDYLPLTFQECVCNVKCGILLEPRDAMSHILTIPLVNTIKNLEHFSYHSETNAYSITPKCSSQKQILCVELGQQNNANLAFSFYLIQK